MEGVIGVVTALALLPPRTGLSALSPGGPSGGTS